MSGRQGSEDPDRERVPRSVRSRAGGSSWLRIRAQCDGGHARVDRVRPARVRGSRSREDSAMTLLELRGIDKYRAYGSRRVPVLRDVSLELDAGELVAVWGLPGSGRSTLLAIAAGIDPPDAGTVRFGGRDLAGRGAAVLGG